MVRSTSSCSRAIPWSALLVTLAGLVACGAFVGANEDEGTPDAGGGSASDAGPFGDGPLPGDAQGGGGGDASGTWLERVAALPPGPEVCPGAGSGWPGTPPGTLGAPALEPSDPPTGTSYTCSVAQAGGDNECGASWKLAPMANGVMLTLAFRLVALKSVASGPVEIFELDGEDDGALDVDLKVDPTTRRASLRLRGDELARVDLQANEPVVVLRIAFQTDGGFLELREGCAGTPVIGWARAPFPAARSGANYKLGITTDSENVSVTVSGVRGHVERAP